MLINIAIVDNEKGVLENIRGILLDMLGDSKDIHIDMYEKAKDFLAAFEKTRYQILISDVDMPEMNGIEMGKKRASVIRIFILCFLQLIWNMQLKVIVWKLISIF